MDYEALAELIFPNIDKTPDYYDKLYPKRNLPEGAMVTRFAPSPTGFVHMGSLFSSFVDVMFARQTNGIFILRIEDTDQKREVENGTELIIKDLVDYNYQIDEGPTFGGDYGSYIQSEREDVYKAYVKDLIKKGLAYPCFTTEEELSTLRKFQEANKLRLGYYGEYAKYRNATLEEVKGELEKGTPFVIRLKSQGNYENRVSINDLIKGEISFPENDMDLVILKQDGLPTYHLAHIIDDYLMRITHIVRGDEWVSSVPVHIELNKVLGFIHPHYCQLAPINKNDNGSVRKLSKRKDPEAAVSYYREIGVPNDVVKLYLATIFNSNFEEWYMANPDKTIFDFEFSFNKMAVGGSLFDLEKLMNISKIYFSRKKAIEIYDETLKYCEIYDTDFAKVLKENKDYSVSILNIEREVARPRKDIAAYSDVKKEIAYMYDEYFYNDNTYKNIEMKDYYDPDMIIDYVNNYYDDSLDQNTWFDGLKDIAEKYGYAREMKDYKQNPDNYKGNVANIAEALRVMVAGRLNTPNLYDILNLLGKENIIKRINYFKEKTSL